MFKSHVSTTDLYQEALRKKLWVDKTIFSINSLLEKLKLPSLRNETWQKITSNYIISVTNTPADIEKIYAGLIQKTSENTGISMPVIRSIFDRTSFSIDAIQPLRSDFTVKIDGNKTLITIGEITERIPTYIYEALKENQDMLTRLVLRYSMFGMNDGVFWSMPPEMISALDDGQQYTIECFASPFNFTAKNFCSAFEEDKNITYPPGYACHGDFKAMMSGLHQTFKIRFLYNPPYTRRIIDNTLSLINRFLISSPESEIIAMLPNRSFESIDQLLSLPGTAYMTLNSNDYEIYSHAEEKSFTPLNLELKLIVRMGENVEHSRFILREIHQKFFMKKS